MAPRALDGAFLRRARARLVADPDLAGRSLARRLAQQTDSWLETLASDIPGGWAVVGTGGYAGGVLAPGSDIDVVLLHPPKSSDAQVREVAEHLWYPFWDAGMKLSPAAHTVKSFVHLAADDLETATSILRVRAIAGDTKVAVELQSAALDQWRRRPFHWLQRLAEAAEGRWDKHGDVASLLEPDLKDGRGGLRDHDMLRWALAVDRSEVTASLESPFEDLAGPADLLLAVRCELHRTTGRTSNVLLLQEQDAIAEAMGFADADALMMDVAGAGHAIEWAGQRFWRRIERIVRRGGRSPAPSPHKLPDHVVGVSIVDDEVTVALDADIDEPSFVFRVAAAAAHAGVPIGARALRMMASRRDEPAEPWSERTRRAFLSLLGAGRGVVQAVEALERYDLFSHYLPEWRHVRSKPQRNAFHRYTVDHHLLQTVAGANDLVRSVTRPDLLLVGALLHDIGKGLPGDHTEVGMEVVPEIARRMGFEEDDVATLRALVEHHLLLAETATRRDLGDPRTARIVADAVGDQVTLELLHALTIADSHATGPGAWSDWKSSLIDQLVAAVAATWSGRSGHAEQVRADERFAALVARLSADGRLHVEHGRDREMDVLRIASRDRPGLISVIAGTLSSLGLDVVSAQATTLPDGAAVDEFRIQRPEGVEPSWQKVEQLLHGVLDGEVDIEARLEQRVRTYGRARRRLAAAAAPPRLEIRVSNDDSDTSTMIDVRAPDGVGVLYRLSRTLAEQGLDIRSAKVATLGHEVVDVFYVQQHGAKVAVDHHGTLIDQLRAALDS